MIRAGALLIWILSVFPLAAQNPPPPRFEKLGTIARGISDAAPVVFLGALYRLECVPPGVSDNMTGQPYLRLVNMESGVVGRPFARGHRLACAFATEEKLYVYCVAGPVSSEITVFWTSDTETWSGKPVFRMEGWELGGTSVCREKDRFLMAFESAEPETVAPTPMTIRFAESRDLLTWHLLPAGYVPSTKRVPLAPKLVFDDIYYYLFFNQVRRDGTIEVWVARSTDLAGWAQARRNPVLAPGAADPKPSPSAMPGQTSPDPKSTTSTLNINFDFCSHRGRVIMYYAWGDASGETHLAEAVYRGFMRDWVVPFFRKSTE